MFDLTKKMTTGKQLHVHGMNLSVVVITVLEQLRNTMSATGSVSIKPTDACSGSKCITHHQGKVR